MHISSQLRSAIDVGDNVLLLYPVFEAESSGICLDLLTLDGAANKNVLYISFTRSLDQIRAVWDQHVGTAPGDAAVVKVAADTRSTATDEVSMDHSTVDTSVDFRVERVTTPGDLTTLGVRISDCLNKWDNQQERRQTVACFESITTLLQYTTAEKTFKFLNILTDQLTSAEAITHYHLDPVVPDEDTLDMLTHEFDMVCEYENDEWIIG